MRLRPVGWGCALMIGLCFFLRPLFGAEPTDTTQAVIHPEVTVRATENGELDLAKLQVQGRVVYVSSGAMPFAARMIDDDLRTTYRFFGTDLHPTVIVELAGTELLRTVGAVFDAEEQVKLEIYLLNQLPNNLDDFKDAKPLTCTINRSDVARAAIDFTPTGARYVAYRWTRTKATRTSFTVAEVSAFGTVSSEQFPPILAETNFKETSTDFSNKLGTLADPPNIPVLSP